MRTPRDQKLLDVYLQGFKDELAVVWPELPSDPYIRRAYVIGRHHAEMEEAGFDYKSEEEILIIIKTNPIVELDFMATAPSIYKQVKAQGVTGIKAHQFLIFERQREAIVELSFTGIFTLEEANIYFTRLWEKVNNFIKSL
jgi:hypothetical protein